MNREQIIEAMAMAMAHAEDDYDDDGLVWMPYKGDAIVALTALETAVPGLADVISGKAVVVPVEPSDGMKTAGVRAVPCDTEFFCEGDKGACLCRETAVESYRAMIEARPK